MWCSDDYNEKFYSHQANKKFYGIFRKTNAPTTVICIYYQKDLCRRTGISFAVTSGQRHPDEDMLREEESER